MIKKVKQNDLKKIIFIEKSLPYDIWSYKMFNSEFYNKHSLFFKYILNNEILAYIICRYVFNEIDILKIVTHPLHRKKKIGSYLINYLKKFFNKKIFLEVRANNKAAINFYKQNNFKKLYIRKKYYKDPSDDAIIMNYVGDEEL